MANPITGAFGWAYKKVKNAIFPPPPPQDISTVDSDTLRKKEQEFFNSAKGKKVMAKTVEDSKGNKITMAQACANAIDPEGPFDTFENLNKTLRNFAANRKMLLFENDIKNANQNDPQAFADSLSGHLYDPALRLGIANAAKNGAGFGGKDSDFFKQVDSALSAKVFADTLAPVTTAPSSGISEKSMEVNANSQKVMMKMLLMGQLGQSSIYQDKERSDWTDNMTDMFTNGQRVGVILPGVEGDTPEAGKKRESLVSAVYGENRGLGAGNKIRDAATHGVDLKSLDGKGDKQYKEVKVGPKKLNMHRAFDIQYGMDIAAGGLGKTGPNGQLIKNDGTQGHLYSHIKAGDSKHHGALLVGFESEAPGKINPYGHSHKAAIIPKAELASCFGAQKSDRIGDQYGGREMDLSKMNPNDFLETMQRFETYLTENQKNAQSPDKSISDPAKENLKNVTQKLMGKQMSINEMSDFLDETCKMDKEKSKKMLEASRDKAPDMTDSIEKPIEPVERKIDGKDIEPHTFNNLMEENIKKPKQAPSKSLPSIPVIDAPSKDLAKPLPKIPGS